MRSICGAYATIKYNNLYMQCMVLAYAMNIYSITKAYVLHMLTERLRQILNTNFYNCIHRTYTHHK